MHIVFHTQYYPPEIGAPQTRLHELAIGLISRGIEVTVLTAMPNYPKGRIYEGYGGWVREEYLDGVRIIRTLIYPAQSAGMTRRLFSYFSFLLSSLLIGLWKIKDADFLLTESPPLFLGVSGFILSRWKKICWIFNISDLWPQSVSELGFIRRESFIYKLSKALEEFFYRKAWTVTGQSQTILENIQRRVPGVRLYHLPNGVNTTFFRPDDDDNKNENLKIFYAGLHGVAQGLEQILLAAYELRSIENLDFVFVGDGPEKNRLMQTAKRLRLCNVDFLDAVPREQMPKLLISADILIVPLKTQLTGAVPSKLYEAMAVGKPIILIAQSEAARIVENAKCGIVVPPGDINELVRAIQYLKNHPAERIKFGKNGRLAAVQDHDRGNISNKFADFLETEIKRCRQ